MITMFRRVLSVGLLGLALACSSCTSSHHHQVASGPVIMTGGKNPQVVAAAPQTVRSSHCHANYAAGDDPCGEEGYVAHGSAPVYYRAAYGYPGAFTNQSWEATYGAKTCCYYRPKEYVSAGYGCGYYQGQGFPFTW